MLKKTAIRSGWCLLALALAACSGLKQPAAPTEAAGSTNTSTNADNPYGSAPYTPPPASNTDYGTSGSTPSSSGYVPNYSPVDINATNHTVQQGDTIYNISKRYQITQENLRSWNNLDGDSIRLGQILRVKPAGYVASSGSNTSTVTATVSPSKSTTSTTTTTTTTTTTKPPSTTTVSNTSGIDWLRPTAGSILQSFGGNSKGIDFGGTIGQPVVAAASGKVVYAGNGLRGYGNLIIVQHNQKYLTAYGNNQTIMVKEGQQVKRGQQIATMGNTDAKRPQLHFELRENGHPQDPAKFLRL